MRALPFLGASRVSLLILLVVGCEASPAVRTASEGDPEGEVWTSTPTAVVSEETRADAAELKRHVVRRLSDEEIADANRRVLAAEQRMKEEERAAELEIQAAADRLREMELQAARQRTKRIDWAADEVRRLEEDVRRAEERLTRLEGAIQAAKGDAAAARRDESRERAQQADEHLLTLQGELDAAQRDVRDRRDALLDAQRRLVDAKRD